MNRHDSVSAGKKQHDVDRYSLIEKKRMANFGKRVLGIVERSKKSER